MSIEEIKSLLAQCSTEDLHELKETICALITKAEITGIITDKTTSRDMRRESRFDLGTQGSLRRLTNIRAGQKTEYTVEIKNISRNGTCLLVPANFAFSTVVEIVFPGPDYKMKRCLLEVVRIRRAVIDENHYLELGCRSITKKELTVRLEEDHRISELQRHISDRRAIPVTLVTQESINTEEVQSQIEALGHPVQIVNTVQEALGLENARQSQLVVLLDCDRLVQDIEQMHALVDTPKKMAKLAIINDHEQRCLLLKAGVDECLIAEHMEAYLCQMMDRALAGSAIRKGYKIKREKNDVLILSTDNKQINMLGFFLDEYAITWKAAHDISELEEDEIESYGVLFVEFDTGKKDQFRQIQKQLTDTIIIAVCNNLGHGKWAMSCKATEYITMPLSASKMETTLQRVAPYLLEKNVKDDNNNADCTEQQTDIHVTSLQY
ncbi:MAG: PilZ domain-containing protein [Sedimentisphaerales bacterium]|nr:PilZ domain-containing protein [Sedimentisphaerales bacterium]